MNIVRAVHVWHVQKERKIAMLILPVVSANHTLTNARQIPSTLMLQWNVPELPARIIRGQYQIPVVKTSTAVRQGALIVLLEQPTAMNWVDANVVLIRSSARQILTGAKLLIRTRLSAVQARHVLRSTQRFPAATSFATL